MRPKLIFSNYKFRCPVKRAGPPLESKWKCEKIASIRAFVRMKREKESYDISERADNCLNNPETRASHEMVLETAVNGRADGLVTFNVPDFGTVPARFGIEVMIPREVI